MVSGKGGGHCKALVEMASCCPCHHVFGKECFLDWTKLREVTHKNDGETTKWKRVVHDLLQAKVEKGNDAGINGGDFINNQAAKVIPVEEVVQVPCGVII